MTCGSFGMKSGTYGINFYPDYCAFWNVQAGGTSTYSGIKFRDSGGTIDGYVYADDGHIGFLDQDSHWAYGHRTDTCHFWRINNTNIMQLYSGCLCHCKIICSACCVRSAAIYGSSWVCSGGNMYASTCVCSPIVCGASCIQTNLYKSGASNMCLTPSGCGYGIFFGPSNIGEKQHWTTTTFTASGTQARRAKLLEFVYNTHHWDLSLIHI